MLRIVAALYLLLMIGVSQAATCSTTTITGVPVSHCVYNAAGSDPQKLLYYLHGQGGSAEDFQAIYDDLVIRWTLLGTQPAVAVGVSYGVSWTLSDLPSTYVPGVGNLFEHFANDVIGILDDYAVTLASGGAQTDFNGTRYLYGKSMGGYNAGLLATKRPVLWDRVVLGCAALFTVTPFSTPAQKAAYVTRTGASADAVNFGLSIIGADYPTQTDWYRNQPVLWATSLTPTAPPFLVWWNTGDAYGLEEGDQQIATALADHGVNTQTRSNALGHCVQGVTLKQKVAEFLP